MEEKEIKGKKIIEEEIARVLFVSDGSKLPAQIITKTKNGPKITEAFEGRDYGQFKVGETVVHTSEMIPSESEFVSPEFNYFTEKAIDVYNGNGKNGTKSKYYKSSELLEHIIEQFLDEIYFKPDVSMNSKRLTMLQIVKKYYGFDDAIANKYLTDRYDFQIRNVDLKRMEPEDHYFSK